MKKIYRDMAPSWSSQKLANRAAPVSVFWSSGSAANQWLVLEAPFRHSAEQEKEIFRIEKVESWKYY